MSKSEEVKVGDNVQLKANNQITMTVGYIRDGQATCYWYTKSNEGREIKSTNIYVSALKVIH